MIYPKIPVANGLAVSQGKINLMALLAAFISCIFYVYFLSRTQTPLSPGISPFAKIWQYKKIQEGYKKLLDRVEKKCEKENLKFLLKKTLNKTRYSPT